MLDRVLDMNLTKVLEIMDVEQQCVQRNIDECNRQCECCDLVQKDSDLIEAYGIVMDVLRDAIKKEKDTEHYNPETYVFKFGKFKGKTFNQVKETDKFFLLE